MTIECIMALPQHPGDTAAVSDEPVMLRFDYHLGLLTVLVPSPLCLMLATVISAE